MHNGEASKSPSELKLPHRPDQLVAHTLLQRALPVEQTEEQRSLQELDDLRARVMRAKGGRKLHMILDAPSPQALIQRMPAQELLLTLKDIGKSDCAELIELTTRDQLRSCLDLDCWKKDKLLIDQIDDWLEYLTAGEILAAEKVLESLDIETIIYYCMDFFNIYYREDEDWPEDMVGDLVEMPDTFYMIEIPFAAEDKRSSLAHGLLQLFMRYGYEFYHRLFEWIRWGQRTDLEEIAYQFRKSRIEDEGFIDYFEAIGIYQPLPPRAKAPALLPTVYVADETLPMIKAPRRDGLFGEALAPLNPIQQARVERELLFLTNKVMCADLVDPGNLKGITQTMRMVQRTIDLGLEIFTDNNVERASEALSQHPVEWFFRNGVTAMARLRKQGNRIARDKRLTLVERNPLSLLPSPFIDVMRAVRQLKPRYHTGIDALPGVLRPFRHAEDIEKMKQVLTTASGLSTLFFEEFNFSHEELLKWTENEELQAPQHAEDIQFSHLFLTALARFILHGTFELQPLTSQEVMECLNRIFIPAETTPHTIDPTFQEQIESELFKRPNTSAAEREGLQTFLGRVWDTLKEEAAYLPLPLQTPPDARFLNLFLIQK